MPYIVEKSKSKRRNPSILALAFIFVDTLALLANTSKIPLGLYLANYAFGSLIVKVKPLSLEEYSMLPFIFSICVLQM